GSIQAAGGSPVCANVASTVRSRHAKTRGSMPIILLSCGAWLRRAGSTKSIKWYFKLMQKMLALVLSLPLCAQVPDKETLAAQAERFRALMRGAPQLALRFSEFPVQAPNAGWAMEMVS